MYKNEYFSNSYRALIIRKPFHFMTSLIEYLITFIAQITLFTTKFTFKIEEELPKKYFYAIFIQQINKLPEYAKLVIILLLFILIFVYFVIYSKFLFENKHLFNMITINIFEIIIIRCLLLIIFHILLAIKGVPGIIMIIVSIPAIFLIMQDYTYNHLYYFSPHFIDYPYDSYSSVNDIFHIVEKIFLSIALQSSIVNLNQFLFIFTFVLQIGNLVFSLYILYYKSYYIMSNIFLDKLRFSLIASIIINNTILVLLGHNNLVTYTYLLIAINILIAVFLLVQIFYNPYSKSFFSTDDNIENLYFYYYIIDHLRNDSFLLEEKVRAHFVKCQKCNLCKNLKAYLAKKKCYKVVYKILFNKVGVLEHTLNEIIHTVLTKGREALKNNSFYLINLMYCYYRNINKKNYVLSLNLKLMFEIINSENKNILENHLLSTEQITLINDFLSKANNILDKMKLILNETVIREKVELYFSLHEILFDLKSKKFKNKLYYNKNEGIINLFKYISICSMIYEEIFNVTLSNGGISLKENQMFLDDILNKNGLNLNQIIIQLDLLSFENKIIYIIGELAKYKGKALCQLFPNIFKTKQLSLMKNKIMNSKNLASITKDKDFFQNNFNSKGNKIEDQYICLDLLIYDEVNHKKMFVMMSLRLNLIYPLNISKKILLTGFYSINKKIIITLDKSTKESKKEIVLNSDENKYESEIRNYASNEVELIKYKKDDKFYNGKKLLFVTKFYVNPSIYNIYSMFFSEKQRTYKMDKIYDGNQKNNNLYDIESKNNLYAGAESTTQNFNFMMQSQTSSTFNQLSNDVQNFKKRDKGGKKENKKAYFFRYYQICLLLLAFCILLFQIISHITLNNSIKHINIKNDALIYVKNYMGVYNNLFTTILSISCVADDPQQEKCKSVVDYYEQDIIHRRGGPPFRSFLFSQIGGTSNVLKIVREKILSVLSDTKDEILDFLINSEMTTLFITQNITETGTKLIVYKQKNTFIDVLSYMTNGFFILGDDITNLAEPVYIVNRINYDEDWTYNEDAFKDVKLNRPLTSYLNHFYYLMLNYQQFTKKLDQISESLLATASNSEKSNLKTIKIIIIVTFFFYIILQIIVYFFIQRYYKIIAELFYDIEKKMDLKSEKISVREMFLQKIEKLKIIITLYKQDIYQAIVDLNFIYDNYKKFVEEKNKEMAKYLKKEKFLNEKNFNKDDKSKNEYKKHISLIKSNILHIYFIIFCCLASIAVSIALFLIWNSYERTHERIFYLVESHGNLSNDAYKLVNYYQLMIYNSLTFEDINKLEEFDTEKGEDLFHKLYIDLEELYESRKYMTNLKNYNLDNIDKYFDHNCVSFYDGLIETTESLKRNPTAPLFIPYFINICETANIFKSRNYKHIFSMLFEMAQIGINQIDDHSYAGLIAHKKSEHFTNTTMTFLFVYYYTFEILSYRVQRQSFEKISELIKSYLHIGFVVYYIASFIFILIIIIVYITRFNRSYKQLHEMKKVFKICNKRE